MFFFFRKVKKKKEKFVSFISLCGPTMAYRSTLRQFLLSEDVYERITHRMPVQLLFIVGKCGIRYTEIMKFNIIL